MKLSKSVRWEREETHSIELTAQDIIQMVRDAHSAPVPLAGTQVTVHSDELRNSFSVDDGDIVKITWTIREEGEEDE